MKNHARPPIAAALLATLLVGAPSLGMAQGGDGFYSGESPEFNRDTPDSLKGVGIDEHLDAELPLEATFRNQDGDVIQLGDLFDGDLPVILSLNYSNCPMLCSTQLTGLTRSLRNLEWSAGTNYRVVSMSIDPRETPKEAKKSRDRYVELYGRGAEGWTFLVGSQSSITTVAEAVGFHYKYLPERDQYAHAAVAVLCTPEGRVARYLYGVAFPKQTLRLSLIEASRGNIGGAGQQLLLLCFHYDPETGEYAPRYARLAVSIGACLMVLVLVAGVFILKKREPDYAALAEEAQSDSTARTDEESD